MNKIKSLSMVLLVISIATLFNSTLRADEEASNLSAPAAFTNYKISMEKAYEQKTQTLLDALLGKGNSQINVNLTLSPIQKERVTVKSTGGKESDPRLEYLWEDPKKNNSSILPGFLNDGGNIKTPKRPTSPVDYVREYSPMASFIQHVEATLLIDKSIPKDKVTEAEKSVIQILGISPTRNDTLLLIQTVLAPGWKQLVSTPEFQIRIAYILIFGLMGLMALYLLYRCFVAFARTMGMIGAALGRPRQPNLKAGAALSDEKTPSDELPLDVVPLLPWGKKKEEEKEEEGIVQDGEATDAKAFEKAPENLTAPFSYINDKNFRMVMEFLKTESPRNICIILSVLSLEMTSKTLESLPTTIRVEVMKQFSQPLTNITAEKEDLNIRLKTFLDGSLDTAEQLKNIYSVASQETQKVILRDLKLTNPMLASWLEEMVFKFEDIMNLNESQRVLVFTALRPDIIAASFSELNKELVQSLLKGIPDGLKKRIQQYGELSGPITPANISVARMQLMSVVNQLASEGKISKSPTLKSNKAA